MGVRRIVYRPDRPGKKSPYPGSPFLPFGAFAVSPRMQGLVMKVARDGAILAKMFVPPSDDPRDGHYRDHMSTDVGNIVKIDGLERVTALIVNDAKNAAAIEFGSGESSVGDTSGSGRPQGGWNRPKRPLGKAGMMLGDFHE